MEERIMQSAAMLQDELVIHRRNLHRIPGVGFALEQTFAYVEQELTKLGIEWQRCGKAGITACIGGKQPGKVFLLRGDMDGLPIQELSGEEFASENGNMHACGHDFHTTMLLGAAKLLKERENEIRGTVKLMFQPAEETLKGALDMLENGVLENPKVDAGMMLHVMAGMNKPSGTLVMFDSPVGAAASDGFTIEIRGRGCHGAMPNQGIDPLLAGAHILITLQELNARELAMSDEVALTIGSFHAGNANNVIPDVATLSGTLRTYDENLRAYLKERIQQILSGVGAALRVETELTFMKSCPSLANNPVLAKELGTYAREILGEAGVAPLSEAMAGSGGRISGSEDFSYISRQIPVIIAAVAAGNQSEGYPYPQHHPKVRFDESVLAPGSAVYAHCALRWLSAHGPEEETV